MPDWRSIVRQQLATLRVPAPVEAALVDELAEHLQLSYDERLASGETPEHAAREVIATFNRDDALIRRLRVLRRTQSAPVGDRPRWAALPPDVRTVSRRLRRDWMVTLALIATLAVGIGTTAAIGAAAKLIVLDPLPFKGADRLVNVWLLRASRDNWHFHVPPGDAAALATATQIFERVDLSDTDRRILTRTTSARTVISASVPAGFLDSTGMRPLAGRLFTDRADGDSDAILLGEAIWRRDFGAERAIIGTAVRLDDKPFRIVGVLPSGFTFPGDADVWTLRRATDQSNGYVIARLRPGVSPLQAQAAMPSVVAAITNGRAKPAMSFRVEALRTTATGHARLPWLLLLASAASVVVIAFLNVANLLLSRAVGRRRDVAVRFALGADRFDIFRLAAAEAVLLAAPAAALAIAVAQWTGSALRTWAPEDTPRRADFHLDATVIVTTMLLAGLCWIVLTVVPGLATARAGDDSALRSAGPAVFASRRDSRARSALVVVELALTFVLLAAASLFGASMLRLSAVNPGFRTDHLLAVRLAFPAGAAARNVPSTQVTTQIEQDIRRIPGVSSVATSSGDIMTGLGLIDAQRTLAQRVTRDAGPAPGGPEEAHFRRVSPEFFRTLDLPIVDGRDFSDTDSAGTLPVAIVNQAMARTFWGTTAVVGKRVSFERIDGAPLWLEIVGVAADTRDLALTTAPQPAFFAPLAQARVISSDGVTMFLRSTGDPAIVAGDVRRVIGAVAPAWPVPEVSTMEQAVGRFLAAPRFRTGLVTSLATVGLLLAALGIYTVVSHAAVARAPEMAVRLAMGATRLQIASQVVGQGVRLGVLGMLIGLAASLGLRRLIGSLLFGVAPTDPLILAAAPAVMLPVIVMACYFPARRAAMTDAARVMRGD